MSETLKPQWLVKIGKLFYISGINGAMGRTRQQLLADRFVSLHQATEKAREVWRGWEGAREYGIHVVRLAPRKEKSAS